MPTLGLGGPRIESQVDGANANSGMNTCERFVNFDILAYDPGRSETTHESVGRVSLRMCPPEQAKHDVVRQNRRFRPSSGVTSALLGVH